MVAINLKGSKNALDNEIALYEGLIAGAEGADGEGPSPLCQDAEDRVECEGGDVTCGDICESCLYTLTHGVSCCEEGEPYWEISLFRTAELQKLESVFEDRRGERDAMADMIQDLKEVRTRFFGSGSTLQMH